MITEIFQYGFMVRALEAGVTISLIAPLIGTFLVLRRYSLIADTLAHVSLAGIAAALLLGLNPIVSAITVTLAASLGIERLRNTKRIFGESALALFLSGSLAVATVLVSLGQGLRTNITNYLFGSIMTVGERDVLIISGLAISIMVAVAAIFKELVYTSFDEDTALANGVPVRKINMALIVLSALVVSLSIPIVGVLLISALIVIPPVTALLFRKSFFTTLWIAELISLFSVLTGIFLSYRFDISTGGTIVLVMLGIFALIHTWKSHSNS